MSARIPCPVCRSAFTTRADGTLRDHVRYGISRHATRCEGVGVRPDDAPAVERARARMAAADAAGAHSAALAAIESARRTIALTEPGPPALAAAAERTAAALAALDAAKGTS